MPSGRGWVWVGHNVADELPTWGLEFEEEARTHRSSIALGDPVYWWQTGPRAGIYAVGRVAGSPTAPRRAGKLAGQFLVPVTVTESRLTNPLLWPTLAKHPILQDLVRRCRIRGRNFRPASPAELKAIDRLLPSKTLRANVLPTRDSGQGFGTAPSNKRIEKAAIDFSTSWFREQGWSALRRDAENLGFDLECTKAGRKLNVEVKGTSGHQPRVILTRGELRRARRDSSFRIAIVTSALAHPQLVLMTSDAFQAAFALSPLSFTAVPRPGARLRPSVAAV